MAKPFRVFPTAPTSSSMTVEYLPQASISSQITITKYTSALRRIRCGRLSNQRVASPTCRFFSSKRGWVPVTKGTAITLSVPIYLDRRRSASSHLRTMPTISPRRSPAEGDFDIQATVGTPWPTSNYNILGTQLVTNIAFQYHLLPYLWPEIELNDTYWFNGVRGRLNQLFLTFDAIIGPYPVPGTRAKAALLVGYQTGLTPHPAILSPITPMYNHSWLFGARLFF